jgi:heme exporter protein B
MVGALLLREWKILLRARASIVNPLAFLLLSTLLFAIAAPQLVAESSQRASGILWVLVLFTQLLSLDAMFRRDYDSGTLEQSLIMADVPFVAVLIRIFVQWLSTGLVIVTATPVIGPLLGLSWSAVPGTMLALLLGTPALSLLGSIGAGITVGFSRGGIILALLVLPLFLPVLIFGTDIVNAAGAGLNYTSQVYWLALISLAALIVSPFAALAGLRISVEMQ